jgi:chromate transporter
MTLWQMLLQIAAANMLTFGNGSVMAALLQHAFVQQAQVLTNDQLLYAFALARVTPGQANLYVASIAYMMFGLPGAALSMAVIALPSYVILPLLRSYQLVRDIRPFRGFTRGLASTAVGLLLATSWNLSKGSLVAPVSWAVLVLALGLMLWSRLPTVVSLLLASGVGAVVVLASSAAG